MITKEQLHNEFLYEMTMQMAKDLLDEGIITPSEYGKIDTKYREKYRPYFGSLCEPETLN